MDNETLMRMQEAHQQAESYEEQLRIVDQQINELQAFDNSISDLEKSKENEILASIGKGVYAKSEIKDRKLFIEVGAGVFVRKTIEETRTVVEYQIKRLGEMRLHLSSQMAMLNAELQNLLSNAQKE